MQQNFSSNSICLNITESTEIYANANEKYWFRNLHISLHPCFNGSSEYTCKGEIPIQNLLLEYRILQSEIKIDSYHNPISYSSKIYYEYNGEPDLRYNNE